MEELSENTPGLLWAVYGLKSALVLSKSEYENLHDLLKFEIFERLLLVWDKTWSLKDVDITTTEKCDHIKQCLELMPITNIDIQSTDLLGAKGLHVIKAVMKKIAATFKLQDILDRVEKVYLMGMKQGKENNVTSVALPFQTTRQLLRTPAARNALLAQDANTSDRSDVSSARGSHNTSQNTPILSGLYVQERPVTHITRANIIPKGREIPRTPPSTQASPFSTEATLVERKNSLYFEIPLDKDVTLDSAKTFTKAGRQNASTEILSNEKETDSSSRDRRTYVIDSQSVPVEMQSLNTDGKGTVDTEETVVIPTVTKRATRPVQIQSENAGSKGTEDVVATTVMPNIREVSARPVEVQSENADNKGTENMEVTTVMPNVTKRSARQKAQARPAKHVEEKTMEEEPAVPSRRGRKKKVETKDNLSVQTDVDSGSTTKRRYTKRTKKAPTAEGGSDVPTEAEGGSSVPSTTSSNEVIQSEPSKESLAETNGTESRLPSRRTRGKKITYQETPDEKPKRTRKKKN